MIFADFHIRFERIHPFSDGNGRTGRVLLAKKMFERNYPAFVIPKENRTDYMKLLADCDTIGLANMFQALTNDERKRMEKFGIRVPEALNTDFFHAHETNKRGGR